MNGDTQWSRCDHDSQISLLPLLFHFIVYGEASQGDLLCCLVSSPGDVNVTVAFQAWLVNSSHSYCCRV